MTLSTDQIQSVACFRLGDLVVDPGTNRISNPAASRCISVEPRVMDLLTLLAESPGLTVDRQVILQRCWPDLHVSDDALNRGVWKLRRAFRTLGVQQEWIATVPKRGYRLLATPGPASSSAGRSGIPIPEASGAGREKPGSRFLGLALLAALAASGWFLWGGRSRTYSSPLQTPDQYSFQPVSALTGYESHPTFSPGGDQIAFQHFSKEGPRQGQSDLLVQEAVGGTPRLVAASEFDELAPSWSPTGNRLAFIRVVEGRAWLMLVHLDDGREERIADCGPAYLPPDYWVPEVIWGRDGKSLIHTERSRQGLPSRVLRLDLESRISTQLTLPSGAYLGDRLVALSPNGRRLAVVRKRVPEVEDLFVLDLEEMLERRITFDGRAISGVDWQNDSTLIFSSRRGGIFQLWTLPAAGGTRPRLVPSVGLNATTPRLSSRGEMAYEEWRSQIGIWSLDLTGSGDDRPVVASSGWNWRPQVSPDGKSLAFLSNRTGSTEVWLIGEDDAEARPLTHFGVHFASTPRWSPDSSWIALSVPLRDNAEILLASTGGGEIRRLSHDVSDEIEPVWSRQPGVIGFASNRSGQWEIWEQELASGRSRRVTLHGGWAPLFLDSAELLFVKPDGPGLWKLDRQTGREELLLDSFGPAQIRNGWFEADGIYFVVSGGPDPPALCFLSFNRRTIDRIRPVEGGSLGEFFQEGGISISPDRNRLLVSVIEKSDSDLWLRRVVKE